MRDLSLNPLHRVARSLSNEQHDESPAGLLSPTARGNAAKIPKFWHITFDRVDIKEEDKPKKTLSAEGQKRHNFDLLNAITIEAFQAYWKDLDRKRFHHLIAPNSSKEGPYFYGGLHRTRQEDCLHLFYLAMTKPWNDDEMKPPLKFLDIGHGYGYYLILALLFGFEVIAIDIPEGNASMGLIKINKIVCHNIRFSSFISSHNCSCGTYSSVLIKQRSSVLFTVPFPVGSRYVLCGFFENFP